MPQSTTQSLVIDEQKGIYVCEFTSSRILDETNIKEIGDALSALVDSREGPRIVLDFLNVDHLSSAALGMLINVNNRVKQRKGHLRLCKIRPQILEVFAITKLNRLFKILPTRDEAMQSFPAH